MIGYAAKKRIEFYGGYYWRFLENEVVRKLVITQKWERSEFQKMRSEYNKEHARTHAAEIKAYNKTYQNSEKNKKRRCERIPCHVCNKLYSRSNLKSHVTRMHS